MATDTTSETISNPELRHRNSTSTQQQSRNSTSSNGTAGSSLQHDFRTTTFTSPTFCDYCGSFIWGLAKQGCSCRDCGFAAHKHCFRFVSSSCAAKAGPKSLGMPRSLSNELSQSNHPSSARQQHEISEKEKDLVTQIFAETQVQSKKLENTYLETNPALNIALLLKQNNRFTARQAPFIWINETVIKLLTWDSVPNTLIFLLCYVILCLKPILFVILPQLVILYLIAKFYHYRADAMMNGKPLPKPHPIGTPPIIPTLTFAENKLAMQSIQNTMGLVSDVYDAIYNVYRMIDWSNPELTRDVMYKIAASMVGSVILFSVLPVNIIFLFAGVGAFIANTALFKAMSLHLAPVLVEKLQKRMNHVTKLIRDARKNGKDPIIDVVLFENQRWWAGIGWQAIMLPHERKAWSDETGAITLPTKEHYRLPTVDDYQDLDSSETSVTGDFEWVDEWEIDYQWSDADTEGWTYCNQRWDNPRSYRVMNSFTRRRKWVRHMKLVPLLNKEE